MKKITLLALMPLTANARYTEELALAGDGSDPVFLFIALGLIFWVSRSFKASQSKGWASLAASVVIGYLSFMFASQVMVLFSLLACVALVLFVVNKFM